MTVRTIKITEDEAKRIVDNKIRFIFRGNRACFKENDIIKFRVIKDLHDVLHAIDSRKYIVTAVMDHLDAPVLEGYQFIAFREI